MGLEARATHPCFLICLCIFELGQLRPCLSWLLIAFLALSLIALHLLCDCVSTLAVCVCVCVRSAKAECLRIWTRWRAVSRWSTAGHMMAACHHLTSLSSQHLSTESSSNTNSVRANDHSNAYVVYVYESVSVSLPVYLCV